MHTPQSRAHTHTQITFAVSLDSLGSFSDEYIAQLWHISQANPAPFGDKAACEFADAVGHEIIRRFVTATPPALWAHHGRHTAEKQVMENAVTAPVVDSDLHSFLKGGGAA